MVSKPGETTLRLADSVRQTKAAGRMALRWLTPGAPSAVLATDEGGVTIGRGPGVTVFLDAAGVSRRHVEIYHQGPAHIAHDLGSTNGTYVNGRRVEYAPLAEGDVIRLGDVVGVVARVAADAAAQPPELDVLTAQLAFGPGLASQLAALRRVAPGNLPVVIVGETGVGKEFVARALHHLSGRRGPFHAINCAALPETLAEAELFGHRRGAFTGAEQVGLGHLRAAAGGTLFLDELPELRPAVQAKLLRVLQDGQVTPLGETQAYAVDVRIAAACQDSPERFIASGRLRRDLAARLSGLTVTVPPLRDRRIDVAVFFRRFLERDGNGSAPEVDPRMLERLLLHDWPGNLRELELLARRLLALHGREPVLRRSFLPASMLDDDDPAAEEDASQGTAGGDAPAADRDEHDRRRLGEELRRNGRNITRAASAAHISRSRAYRLMNRRSPEDFLAELEAAALKTGR